MTRCAATSDHKEAVKAFLEKPPTYLQRALKQDNTMPKWSNWSGRLSHKPDSYQQIYSEQQAAALAAYCQQQGQSIRAVGAGHSRKIWWAMTASSWIWLVCRA